MKINILAFGIAKDIVKGTTLELELPNGATVDELKQTLCEQFPEFNRLRSLQVAVNETYQEENFVLQEKDEVVLIPPVSGG